MYEAHYPLGRRIVTASVAASSNNRHRLARVDRASYRYGRASGRRRKRRCVLARLQSIPTDTGEHRLPRAGKPTASSPMGGERGSTARQRMSGKICCMCSNSLPPDPSHHGERLCAKCTEARQPLRDVYMSFMLRDGWYCQFLEADLKTPLPRKFTFAAPE